MYTFSFDSFQITDTRSPHKDTDYASLSLAVGSALGAPDGEIGGLLFANRDGPVAAGVHVFTAAERREIISATDHNPGPELAARLRQKFELLCDPVDQVRLTARDRLYRDHSGRG